MSLCHSYIPKFVENFASVKIIFNKLFLPFGKAKICFIFNVLKMN